MSSKLRRFEVLLPLQFNDGRDVPADVCQRGAIFGVLESITKDYRSNQESEDGCVLEVFNAVSESIAVVAVPISVVEALRADEILTVRSLAQVGQYSLQIAKF